MLHQITFTGDVGAALALGLATTGALAGFEAPLPLPVPIPPDIGGLDFLPRILPLLFEISKQIGSVEVLAGA